ncbi:MAG TPA: NADH-quinone oxidoreductase subunit J [Bryobacterales bacterium]|jgi:NADH-quinone oxidoreductase subunit J|nr:NADH-quinone oxidoreductase subunit J [Bryobacterales bacterium]
MEATFYIASAVAVIATVLMLTRLNAVHALLYLIVSLLAVAVVFFVAGAAFIAALEVIIYAGAIMVLFVFVVMMLNLGLRTEEMERRWQPSRAWIGPLALAAVLLAELVYLLTAGSGPAQIAGSVEPKQVSIVLFGPYLLGVELASMLLLAGLVGAYHLGRRAPEKPEDRYGADSDERRAAAGGDLVHAGSDRPARTP